jgi:hypothetical protein
VSGVGCQARAAAYGVSLISANVREQAGDLLTSPADGRKKTPWAGHLLPQGVCLITGPVLSFRSRLAGEESRSEHFQRNARFLVVPIRSGLLGMTRKPGHHTDSQGRGLAYCPPWAKPIVNYEF